MEQLTDRGKISVSVKSSSAAPVNLCVSMES